MLGLKSVADRTVSSSGGLLRRLLGGNSPSRKNLVASSARPSSVLRKNGKPLAQRKTSKSWLVFDTETTGIWRKHDPVGVVQVAAILFDSSGRELDAFVSLVDPEHSIPHEATRVHGITDGDVYGAPSRQEIAKALRPLFKQASFVVAHNASFDALAAEWIGIRHSSWVCTMGMAHSQTGGKWPRLEEAADACSIRIELKRMHDAEYDARIAAKIYIALKEEGVADHGGFWR